MFTGKYTKVYKNTKFIKTMITGKEILALLLALVVLAFSYAFINPQKFINSLFIFAIILIVYVTAKKITAYYYESEEEIKIWSFKRYGIYERSYFKTPIPIGLILAFILPILTYPAFIPKHIPWFAVTESEVKPTKARAVKRHQIYSFSEMTEWHLGLISSSGIIASLLLALIAYLLNFPDLARASIYFACFNLLPIGKLDGTKIFFGNVVFWIILALISLIALGYALFLV